MHSKVYAVGGMQQQMIPLHGCPEVTDCVSGKISGCCLVVFHLYRHSVAVILTELSNCLTGFVEKHCELSVGSNLCFNSAAELSQRATPCVANLQYEIWVQSTLVCREMVELCVDLDAVVIYFQFSIYVMYSTCVHFMHRYSHKLILDVFRTWL